MLRLSLAARISMIVLVALLTVWIAAIAFFQRSQTIDRENSGPSPQRIAAIAELIEQTPAAQRRLVLEAVSSPALTARLGDSAAPMNQSQPAEAAIQVRYAAVLSDWSVAIKSPRPQRPGWRLAKFASTTASALRFEIGLKDGEVLVIDSVDPVRFTRLGLPVGFGAGLLGTLVALIALIIMHRETRPLAQLSAAADAMNLAGEPKLLTPSRTSAPEIQALVSAFNRLQTRLSQLIRARMAMLGGISHDVRTFATRLRLRVERIPDEAERQRAIGDIGDMIRLLDDALLASRAGAGELSEELVEFAQVVRSDVEDRKAVGAAIDLNIGREAESAVILGDRLALRRIVANLVDNALKYGRSAHLAVAVDANEMTLTVDDEGPGIPAERRDILLEPFVRLETSRNRRTGGAGLGLAIVRNLVEAHRGSVSIGDAATGGARFTIKLPVFREQSFASR